MPIFNAVSALSPVIIDWRIPALDKYLIVSFNSSYNSSYTAVTPEIYKLHLIFYIASKNYESYSHNVLIYGYISKNYFKHSLSIYLCINSNVRNPFYEYLSN